jgi:hypothetical protein
MNRRKTDIDMNNLKLYIARDEGKWDEDVQKAGELNLFYDTPQLLFNVKDWTSYWGNARKIAHIPSYMYPRIIDIIPALSPAAGLSNIKILSEPIIL